MHIYIYTHTHTHNLVHFSKFFTTLGLLIAFTRVWHTHQTSAHRTRHGVLRRLETMVNLRPTIALYCPLSKAYWMYTSIGSWLQSRCKTVSCDHNDRNQLPKRRVCVFVQYQTHWNNSRWVFWCTLLCHTQERWNADSSHCYEVNQSERWNTLRVWTQLSLHMKPSERPDVTRTRYVTLKKLAGFARVISSWCCCVPIA